MAHMNQEKKARIAAALKLVMPKGWKYSLSVRHHSTIVLTIASAPIDLLAERERVLRQSNAERFGPTHADQHAVLNPAYLHRSFDGELLRTFEAINKALNLGNHNRSDLMTDYFDVGHYVEICIGTWAKPFTVN